MNFIPYLPYVPSDAPINEGLNALYGLLEKKMQSFTFQDYGIGDLTVYGVYPNYSRQRKKVLFVGREARGLSGDNYIGVLFKAYKALKVDNKHLNRSTFHRRMLKINYFVQNPDKSFPEIPSADIIAKQFGEENGTSFAFLNYSKFSNESDTNWNTNWSLAEKSNLEGEFIQGFFDAVNPDLIISMSLRRQLEKFFKFRKIQDLGSASLFEIVVRSRSVHLIEGYHYSAFNVSEEADIYAPVRNYLQTFA